jgi:hypothetical protein
MLLASVANAPVRSTIVKRWNRPASTTVHAESGGLRLPRLQVYTTLEGGGILWNASGVLGEYLAAKRKEDVEGKHILEV